MRRSKRIASLLLAVCMVWGLLPQLRLPARAAENMAATPVGRSCNAPPVR